MIRLFAQEDQDSITGCVIPKTQKIIVVASFVNPKHYKLRIQGKEFRPPLVITIENGAPRLAFNYSRSTYYLRYIANLLYQYYLVSYFNNRLYNLEYEEKFRFH